MAPFMPMETTLSGALGGRVEFEDEASANAAILVARRGKPGKDEGGGILFNDTSTGDTARIELRGNGFLDLRGHDTPELTIGSLEGDGLVFLGSANLIYRKQQP